MGRVGHVEIDEIRLAFPRHEAQDLLDQIPVRIEQSEAFAVSGVLVGEVRYQRGLACAGLADDVDMRPAVGGLDAEPLPVIAEIGLSKNGDSVIRVECLHRIRLAIGRQSERREKLPAWRKFARPRKTATVSAGSRRPRKFFSGQGYFRIDSGLTM